MNAKSHEVTLFAALLVAIALTSLEGCNRQGNVPVKNAAANPVAFRDPAANPYLNVQDLAHFRKGRSKTDILADLDWRAGEVLAGELDGRRITDICCLITQDGLPSVWANTVEAIFINGKFDKFVQWSSYTLEKRPKLGDMLVLQIRMNGAIVSAEDVDKQIREAKPERILPGFSPAIPESRPLPQEELDKNAALRKQFNAAKLDLGMTVKEVEAVFNAKPFESGNVEAGNYRIYGTREHSQCYFGPFFYFQNVLVVFRDDKAIWIETLPCVELWREGLTNSYADFPNKPR